jgi:membrane protein DedA with SNARE-associated domain
MPLWLTIAAGTLVAEDLAAVGAGLLAADGRLGLAAATIAAGAGIWVGDALLWLAGRGAGAALDGRIARLLASPAQIARAREAFAARAGAALVAARFVPGTRTATYVAAGALGIPFRVFAAWTAAAVAVWTPALVVGAAAFGAPVIQAFGRYTRSGAAIVAAVVVTWLAARVGVRVVTSARSWARRLRHWEFWPAWLFYAPVLPWVVLLVLRYGGRAIAAANPGIEDGGFVGESKSTILGLLPSEWVLPYELLESGAIDRRLAELDRTMTRPGWSFPVVLKPDAGQRGAGVAVVSDRENASRYLLAHPEPVIAQQYHPGPYEAGLFYYRRPGEARGRIFSITDKRFPVVTGDGETPLRSLIARHPRFRYQADVFFARHADRLDWTPAAGRSVRLSHAGNHAQGTMFVDGASLETPALRERLDAIASAIPGFHIGRFDVRYRDPRGLMAGTDLAIVELNGVTSEATHIYDPSRTLSQAYATLYRQWQLVFEIGAENLRRGARASSLARLLRLSAAHVAGGRQAARPAPNAASAPAPM